MYLLTFNSLKNILMEKTFTKFFAVLVLAFMAIGTIQAQSQCTYETELGIGLGVPGVSEINTITGTASPFYNIVAENADPNNPPTPDELGDDTCAELVGGAITLESITFHGLQLENTSADQIVLTDVCSGTVATIATLAICDVPLGTYTVLLNPGNPDYATHMSFNGAACASADDIYTAEIVAAGIPAGCAAGAVTLNMVHTSLFNDPAMINLDSFTLNYSSSVPGIEPMCRCEMDAGTFTIYDGTQIGMDVDAAPVLDPATATPVTAASLGADNFGGESAVGGTSTLYLCQSDAALNNDNATTNFMNAEHNAGFVITSNNDWAAIIDPAIGGALLQCPVGVFYDSFSEQPTDTYWANNNGFEGELGTSSNGGLGALTAGTDPGDVENTGGGNEVFWVTTTASNALSLGSSATGAIGSLPAALVNVGIVGGQVASTHYTHDDLCPGDMDPNGRGAYDLNTADAQMYVFLNEIVVTEGAAGDCNGLVYELQLNIQGGLPDYDVNGPSNNSDLAAPNMGESYTVEYIHSGGSTVLASDSTPNHDSNYIITIPSTEMGDTITINVKDDNGCTMATYTHTVASTCGCTADNGTWN